MHLLLHQEFATSWFATSVHGIHLERLILLSVVVHSVTQPQSGHNTGKIKPASDVYSMKTRMTEIY